MHDATVWLESDVASPGANFCPLSQQRTLTPELSARCCTTPALTSAIQLGLQIFALRAGVPKNTARFKFVQVEAERREDLGREAPTSKSVGAFMMERSRDLHVDAAVTLVTFHDDKS